MVVADRIPREFESGGLLVLAPHPDDETLGLGSLLASCGDRVAICFLTDGAPRSRRYWSARFRGNRRQYRQCRRREARAAARILGVPQNRLHFLAFGDLQLYRFIGAALELLTALCRRLHPRTIFVPAYEGGHPDHDAANFLAAELPSRLPARIRPEVWEFPLYTWRRGGVRYGWMPCRNAREYSAPEPELVRKRRALAAYASQRQTWQAFPLAVERVCRLREHDYRRPACRPTVWEQWGWPLPPETLSAAVARFATPPGSR